MNWIWKNKKIILPVAVIVDVACWVALACLGWHYFNCEPAFSSTRALIGL
tara:strand:+ start:202 stop:351 length:150 start_codon:yes stop_codon:yes gene_type:complete